MNGDVEWHRAEWFGGDDHPEARIGEFVGVVLDGLDPDRMRASPARQRTLSCYLVGAGDAANLQGAERVSPGVMADELARWLGVSEAEAGARVRFSGCVAHAQLPFSAEVLDGMSRFMPGGVDEVREWAAVTTTPEARAFWRACGDAGFTGFMDWLAAPDAFDPAAVRDLLDRAATIR